MPDSLLGGILLLIIAMGVVFLVLAFLALAIGIQKRLFGAPAPAKESGAEPQAYTQAMGATAVAIDAEPEGSTAQEAAGDEESLATDSDAASEEVLDKEPEPVEPVDDAWTFSGRSRSTDPRR